MSRVLMSLLCFSQGIVAGSAWVALLTVLDLVPRLATLTRPRPQTVFLEMAILGGSLYAALADLGNLRAGAGGVTMGLRIVIVVPLVSLFCGVFIGMLAASLAEVLNVLPVLTRRFGIHSYAGFLISALAIGKTVGSFIGFILD